jgi:hypothetical protein
MLVSNVYLLNEIFLRILYAGPKFAVLNWTHDYLPDW